MSQNLTLPSRISGGVPDGGRFARNGQADSGLELDFEPDGMELDDCAEADAAAYAMTEKLGAEMSAKLGMPTKVSTPTSDNWVPGRFEVTVEAGDVWASAEFDVDETTVEGLVAELAPKFTEDPVFRKNLKAAVPVTSTPVKPAKDKPPAFTPATADISAFDPAARAALIASLAPKSVGDEGGYTTIVGSKYIGFQPAAVVSKQIRTDLKAAQASGALPAGVTYKVNSDSFAGGQAVRITAMGLPDSALVEPNDGGVQSPRRTTESAELDRTLMAIGGAYDRAQSGLDMHSPTYFLTVTLESEHSREYREFDKAQKPIQAAWQRYGPGAPDFPNTVRGSGLNTEYLKLLAAREAFQAEHPHVGYR